MSVNSGVTDVLCEARRGPLSPVVNKEVMQRVASPFSHSSSPFFFSPPPFVPTLWLTSEFKVLPLCVWPAPISDPVFCIVNSAQRLSRLIYSLAHLGLCMSLCG